MKVALLCDDGNQKLSDRSCIFDVGVGLDALFWYLRSVCGHRIRLIVTDCLVKILLELDLCSFSIAFFGLDTLFWYLCSSIFGEGGTCSAL